MERLARALAARGVAPGALVAVCAARSLDMVAALLAIMRSGAAYVPIDPEAPAARIRTILEASRPRATLAHPHVADTIRAAGVEPMLLDSARVGEACAPLPALDPRALAYVIFTSGSTGTPKGVEICQHSLLNHALAMAELYGIGPSDHVLCSASIGFDVAGEQIYPALIRGAEVVVRPEDLFSSFARFDALLREASITTLMLPTAFFHEWTRELDAGRLTLPPLLRALGTGTEAVSAPLLANFLGHARGRVRFLQGYGPTETTITCTAYLHDGRSFAPGEAVPIGLPLPNTEAYVLDEAGTFASRVNLDLVELTELEDRDIGLLHRLVREHEERTASPRARTILVQWESYLPLFRKVAPKGAEAYVAAAREAYLTAERVEAEPALARRSA